MKFSDFIQVGVSVVSAIIAFAAVFLTQFTQERQEGIDTSERLTRMEINQEYIIESIQELKEDGRNESQGSGVSK